MTHAYDVTPAHATDALPADFFVRSAYMRLYHARVHDVLPPQGHTFGEEIHLLETRGHVTSTKTGYTLTEAGVSHWEAHIQQWEAGSLSHFTRKGAKPLCDSLLLRLSEATGWTRLQHLAPGHRGHAFLTLKRLVGQKLVDMQQGFNREWEFQITDAGRAKAAELKDAS